MKFSELQRLQRREGITALSADERIEQLEVRLRTVTKERDALRAKIEAMEKERDNANAAAVGIALGTQKLEEDRAIDTQRMAILVAELNRAERERDALRAALRHEADCVEAAKAEIEALRAKVERMEKQEPVAWLHETRRDSDVVTNAVKCVWQRARPMSLASYTIPLYLAPGAQPAPIIPEGWKPIPEKHPTFDLVDLRLADGSVLCGCIPQSDGDYWWEGPSGEVFIDPKYASVTHWRLAAAPEAKP